MRSRTTKFCIILGQNIGTGTYTGAVFYNEQNRELAYISRQIAVQNGKAYITIKGDKTEVVIQNEQIEGIKQLDKRGYIVENGVQTQKDVKAVISIGYIGMVHYHNGKVKAKIVQQVHGVSTVDLADIVDGDKKQYIRVNSTVQCLRASEGRLIPMSLSNYYLMSTYKDEIMKKVSKLRMLGKQTDSIQAIQFALDRHVCTTEPIVVPVTCNIQLADRRIARPTLGIHPIQEINPNWRLKDIYGIVKQCACANSVRIISRIENIEFLNINEISLDSMVYHGYQIYLEDRLNLKLTGIEKIAKKKVSFANSHHVTQFQDFNSLKVISQHGVSQQHFIQNLPIGKNIRKIGQYAFAQERLENARFAKPRNIVIPEQCRFIGNRAFKNNTISLLKIESKNINMHDEAFREAVINRIIAPKELFGNIAILQQGAKITWV